MVQSLDHSLAAYVGDGPADSSVLRIFHRVLAAVDALYIAGSSHPPLSPETIRLDDHDRPHIKPSSRAHEMADTIAFGSAKYSTPEAFVQNGNGSGAEIADCYVLGFIFYEILIGRRLFDAQFASLENGPPLLWLKWHADTTLKARPLSELRPSLGHFANLIDGMIEKDPSKRIGSLSQVVAVFSSVEAQTTYHADAADGAPGPPKLGFEAIRTRLASTATGLANRLSAFVTPRVAAVAVLTVVVVIAATLLLYRESSSRSVRRLVPAVLASVPRPATKPASNPVGPDSQNAAPVRLPPELTLRIESHLPVSASLFLDDQQPIAVSPDSPLTKKIVPGHHNLRFVAGSEASLTLPVNIAAAGDASFFDRPKAHFLEYEMSASNGFISIVLAPGEAAARIPVQIAANVPDAEIVINGKKLTHKLNKGVRVVRLPAGEYRVKVVRAQYQDSAEQDLVINRSEQERRLRFTLLPIVQPEDVAVSAVSPLDSASAGGMAPSHAEAAKQFGKITFHIRPESAYINCRREDNSQLQDCPNNQPCVLREGGYEVTMKADGFKTEVNHIAIGAGDDKPYDWKLEAISSASGLKPADFFEDGQTWTVDSGGWWTHTQAGYSFLRANQGVFNFDILQPSGLFANKKVSLVVNYKSDENRVLYTIDDHKLRRNERAPGIQIADYFVAHETPPDADYRFTLEISSDHAIIRDAAGQILDNLPLINAAAGKVGFSGKLKLKIVQAN